MTTNDPLDPMIPAQPQPSKARKEQAPRAQGSPASGKPSEQHPFDVEVCYCGQEVSKHDQSHDIRIIPQRSEQPRGQQQEWTREYVHQLMRGAGADARIADAHSAELAAERQRCEGLLKDYQGECDTMERWKQTALSALAAIEKHNAHVYQRTYKIEDFDLSALHEHDAKVEQKVLAKACSMISERNERDANRDAKVREPLVKALEFYENCNSYHDWAHDRGAIAKNALAKVKEQ